MTIFRRRPLEMALALVLAGSALPSYALKLGEPMVHSYVGQPLVAEYPILDSTSEELRRLSIVMANPEVYSTVRANFHPALRTSNLKVVQKNDKYSVVVTTDGPVEDSVVDIVFELTWAAGKMIQASTVLIDVAPDAAVIEAPSFVADELVVVSPPAAAGREIIVQSLPKMDQARHQASQGDVVVRRGDTLGKIARRVLPNVPLEQSLIALYNKNSKAIASKNVNLIREGTILTVPSEEEARAVDASAALKTLALHASNFRDYSARLATQSLPAQQAPAGLSQTGSVQTQTTQFGENVTGDAVRVGAGISGETNNIQKDKAHSEAKERQDILDKNILELKKLVEVKNVQLAKLQESTKTKADLTPPPDKNTQPVVSAPTSESAVSDITGGPAKLVNPESLLDPTRESAPLKSVPSAHSEVKSAPDTPANASSSAPPMATPIFQGVQPVVETPTLPDTMRPNESVSDQSTGTAVASSETASAGSPAVGQASATSQVKPKPKQKTSSAVASPPPSPPPPPEENIFDYWSYAAGGVGLLALLGGWIHYRRKNRLQEGDKVEIVTSSSDTEQNNIEESEETTYGSDFSESEIAPHRSFDDAIAHATSEADVFAALDSLDSLDSAGSHHVEPQTHVVSSDALTLETNEEQHLPDFDISHDDHAIGQLTQSLAQELPQLNVPLQGSDKESYPVSVSYDPDEQLGIAKFYLGLQDYRGVWDMVTPLLSHEREDIQSQAHALLEAIPEELRIQWQSEAG